jgi:DNA uptake protein ComE-like DNA-binding protein
MKKAWLFALGALGALAAGNYWKRSAREVRRATKLTKEVQPVRRGKKRFRHRTEDGLLDLNSATIFELKELSGIDDDLATRIMDNRPYATKLDLIGRRVIPDAVYQEIKHAIVVTHAA